ncbi:unnamed protein product [Arctogadus glacialis]
MLTCFLINGIREAKYPSEVPQKYKVTTKKVEQMIRREEVYRGLEKQEETFKVVHKNICKKQEAVRKRKMKKGESLGPGKELESEIVNAYRSTVLTMSSKRCKVIDTFR